MDTKLRNYDGAKKFGCFLSGLLFMAAGTLLFDRICKIFYIYDFKNFLGWGIPDLGLREPSEEAWSAMNVMLSESWKGALFYGIIALASLVFCIWATGKKLNWFDKIFTEIQVMLFALAATGIVGTSVIHIDCLDRGKWYDTLTDFLAFNKEELQKIYEYRGGHTSFEPQWLETFFAYGATAVLLGICLVILLSWVKKLKAGCFWKGLLVGWLVCATVDAIKESRGVQGKLILLLILGALLSATWIGLIVVLVFIIFFVPKLAKKYVAIREGVEEVKNGNLSYKIPVSAVDSGKKLDELDRLALDINEISDSMSVAVANELKNQKLKTDLISNVSHDLKTPLTSMVSYVDLLKTEGLDSPNAPEYVNIIDEKTRRLRKLTEDLFEAAKASSGSIPVHMDRIEMTSIVSQALAETEERLAASGLQIIFTDKTGTQSGEGIYVMADGQLLWRVMENLLVNVSKYALPGSRVYLDLWERDRLDGSRQILMEIKNISKERLNIDAEELMERFKRGDESRNTEGSGLGLAIAKDLVNLMEGEFQLTVDGDLFKAAVGLTKA